ncbi:hypothetical protein C4577_03970 [Candidatus Parcubacteria bacterium]|nr:MAG: hypothetical protein C4577_03970 [Candidatus Parcubacteria bacterium]
MSAEDLVCTLDTRIQANSEAIKALWKPDAEKMVDLIDQGNSLVIVTAPGGSGKSVNLVPNIVSVGTEKGYRCARYDCQRLAGYKNEEVPKAIIEGINKQTSEADFQKVGIIILDELQMFNGDTLVKVLDLLHKQGYKGVVGLIPVNITEQRGRRIQPLIEAEKVIGGQSTIYEMHPKPLPKEIAVEYLELRGVPSGLTKYIVDNYPCYPRTLELLRGENSEEEVLHTWYNLSLKGSEGYGFSEEEAAEVNTRLGLFH